MVNDSLLNEVNEIIDYTDTHFYINIAQNPIQYGGGTKTKEFKNTKKIIETKPGWYNFVLERPLKGGENKNIQYIIEVEGSYGIASIKPLTIEDINNIDLKEWNFKPFKEWEEIWKQNKKVK